MFLIRWVTQLFTRQPYEECCPHSVERSDKDCCPHYLCPDELEEP